ELVPGADRARAVEGDLDQFLAPDVPCHLIVQRRDPVPGAHVEHLAGRRVRPSAVEAERDPSGLLAHGHLRLGTRRHDSVVEDVHQLVVPIADPQLTLVWRQANAVARAPVPLDGPTLSAFDLDAMELLPRSQVEGVERGPFERHGCPSHGIGLTPDGRELWVCDGHNSLMHVFDNTVMPPRPKARVPVRGQPGWITFSLDGRRAYPSTGEVFDVRTRNRVAALDDEMTRHVGSEKLIEIAFTGP